MRRFIWKRGMNAHEAETRQVEALVQAGEPNLAVKLVAIRKGSTCFTVLAGSILVWMTGIPIDVLAKLARVF